MPAAAQAAAPAAVHSAFLSTKLSLMTVSFMFETFTQMGTSSDAGCWVPAVPDGGEVVPLSKSVGGVRPAVNGVSVFPQMTELYPWAKETAFGSEFSPPSSSKTCGLGTFQAVMQSVKPLPI